MPAMTKDTPIEVLREICDMQERNYGKGIETHIELIGLAERGRVAITNAEATQAAPDDYGTTDFGFTYAGIKLTDGDKRLMSMLVKAFGTAHPAVDDMASLLFRAATTAPAAAPTKYKKCPTCKGVGIVGFLTQVKCGVCDGSGNAQSETEAAVELPEKPPYSFIQCNTKYVAYATLDDYATEAVFKDRADRRMK